MYKVLLVDDETVNYQLFEKLVSWEEKGFEIVGTAKDGVQALEKYESLQPDVLFLDIQLPRMDGLECARCIRESDERTKIVIVSAYDEFSYAQRAIRYGVTDYLLKPVSRLVLNQLVDKLKTTLDEEAARQGPGEAGPVPSLDLSLILEGGREASGLKEAPLLGLIVYEKNALPASRDSFRRLLEEVPLAKGCSLGLGEGRACLEGGGLVEGKTALEALCGQVLAACEGMGLRGECYPFLPAQGQAAQWMEQFKQLESYGFYQGGEKSYVISEGYFSGKVPPLQDSTALISEAIAGADPAPLWKEVLSFTSQAREERTDPRKVKEELFDLLLKIKFLLGQLDRKGSFLVMRDVRPETIYRYQTLEGLLGWFSDRLQEAFTEIQAAFFGQGRRLVLRTNAFVETSYMNSSFSVQDAADYNGISRNYFTSQYKEQAGIGFWDYVTARRMEKARELLLATDELVGTIANRVGYESEYHFSRKFKELVGESPNQYRRNRKK